ncbi:putative DNA helicase INO80 [Smittium culicis]|uniref:Chromatin-remodeling ATPase INO80 n=1 Tax=Smittium culicis TaxID=133412 RepID=A0A1R1X840_9FUNG|nr:putative DNA helicase INO80 [Smittium culicis]
MDKDNNYYKGKDAYSSDFTTNSENLPDGDGYAYKIRNSAYNQIQASSPYRESEYNDKYNEDEYHINEVAPSNRQEQVVASKRSQIYYHDAYRKHNTNNYDNQSAELPSLNRIIQDENINSNYNNENNHKFGEIENRRNPSDFDYISDSNNNLESRIRNTVRSDSINEYRSSIHTSLNSELNPINTNYEDSFRTKSYEDSNRFRQNSKDLRNVRSLLSNSPSSSKYINEASYDYSPINISDRNKNESYSSLYSSEKIRARSVISENSPLLRSNYHGDSGLRSLKNDILGERPYAGARLHDDSSNSPLPKYRTPVPSSRNISNKMDQYSNDRINLKTFYSPTSTRSNLIDIINQEDDALSTTSSQFRHSAIPTRSRDKSNSIGSSNVKEDVDYYNDDHFNSRSLSESFSNNRNDERYTSSSIIRNYPSKTETVKSISNDSSIEEAALGLLGMNSSTSKTPKMTSQNRVSISNLLSNTESNFSYSKSSVSYDTAAVSEDNQLLNDHSSVHSNINESQLANNSSCSINEPISSKTELIKDEFYVNNKINNTKKAGSGNLTGKEVSPHRSNDSYSSYKYPNSYYDNSPPASKSNISYISNSDAQIIDYGSKSKYHESSHDDDNINLHDRDEAAKDSNLYSHYEKTQLPLRIHSENESTPKKIVIQSIKLQRSSAKKKSNFDSLPGLENYKKPNKNLSREYDSIKIDEAQVSMPEKLKKREYLQLVEDSSSKNKYLKSRLNKNNSNDVNDGIESSSSESSDTNSHQTLLLKHKISNGLTKNNEAIVNSSKYESDSFDEIFGLMAENSSFFDEDDSESYKEYLYLRGKLAVQSYERRTKRKRQKYHKIFLNKFKKRLPKKFINDSRILTPSNSCPSGSDSDGILHDKSEKNLAGFSKKRARHSVNESNQIISRVYSKLMSEDRIRNKSKHLTSLLFKDNPYPDNFYYNDSDSRYKGSLNRKNIIPPDIKSGSRGFSTPRKSRNDKYRAEDVADSSPLSASNKSLMRENCSSFEGKDKKNGVFLRIGHLQRQIRNTTSSSETLKTPSSGTVLGTISSEKEGHILKNSQQSSSQKNKSFESSNQGNSGVDGSSSTLKKHSHNSKNTNKQPVYDWIEIEVQRQKEEIRKKQEEISNWRANFKAIVSDGVPKAYKQYLLSVSSRQNNLKKVSLLCQREVKRSNGPSIIRGGPVTTLGDNRAPKEAITKARRSTRETLLFWKRHEKEEREARKKAEKEAQDKIRLEEEAREATRQSRKLNFLITQTELYSHFVGEKVKGNKGTALKASDSNAMEELDFADATDEAIHERASMHAQAAIALQLEKTKEFDADRPENLDVSDAVDSMNFQEPSTLGGGVETTQPRMMMCKLKEYQLKGLQWLANLYEQGINGILADEMGLGKTIQSISLMAYLAEVHGIWGPFMVVAPSSTLHNWQQEISRFTPDFKILPYWGTQKDRKILRKSFWNLKNLGRRESAFHILITSYQLVVIDEPVLNRVKWQYMVLDEAQAIKSSSSARWKSLLQFRCRNRLLLTGTPIQNSMQELWALLHFIMPSLFDSHEEFSEWFSRDIEAHAENNSMLNGHQLKRLHVILKPFMLRRIKKHVQHELGDKIEHLVPCHLTHRQAQMYSGLMRKVSISDLLARIQNTSLNNGESDESLMNLVMQFRKVCNHPELFERAEVESPFAFSNYSSSKINRPCSQSIFTPLKSPISYYMPRLVMDMVYDTEFNSTFKYRKLNGIRFISTDLNIWQKNIIFSTSSISNGMSFLKMCTDLSLCLDSGYSLITSFFEGVESRFNLISSLKTYFQLGIPGLDDGAFNRILWNSSGLDFTIYNDKSTTLGLNSFEVLSDILNTSFRIFNYSVSKAMSPAYKPSVVALVPELHCSDVSFTRSYDSFLLNHPLRDSLSFKRPTIKINNSLSVELLNSSNYFSLSKPFLNCGNSHIWTPSVDKLIRYSGKMAVLDELLVKLKAEDHRVLIYFQMTRMIDLMEEYLAYRQYSYLRLDGSSKISDRRNMVMDWQTRPEIFIFLLSTRAGGLGINLTAADTVIFYDSDWNPTVDQQAMDRAHRLGQTKQVTVYRLITQGTIEGRILERASQKNSIHKIVIAGGDTNTSSSTDGNKNALDGHTTLPTSSEGQVNPRDDNKIKEGTLEDGGSNLDNETKTAASNKDKKSKSSSSQKKDEQDDDYAFAPAMMELKPNDIASLLLDETNGNDDKIWSDKLLSSRNDKYIPVNTESSLINTIENTRLNIQDISSNCQSSLSTQVVTSSALTPNLISGSADHHFDAYYAAIELQNELNKNKTTQKSFKRNAGLQTPKNSKPKRQKKRTTAKQNFKTLSTSEAPNLAPDSGISLESEPKAEADK